MLTGHKGLIYSSELICAQTLLGKEYILIESVIQRTLAKKRFSEIKSVCMDFFQTTLQIFRFWKLFLVHILYSLRHIQTLLCPR